MVERRWLRSVGPGVIALGAIVAMGSSVGAARDRVWTPLACVGGGAARVDAVRAQIAISVADARHRGVDAPRPDSGRRRGTLTGQRLAMGVGDAGSRLARWPCRPSRSRPGRSGGCSSSGADDGSLSRLFTIDVATGCTSLDRRGARCHPARDDRARRRRRLRDPRRPDDAGPTSASGGGRSTALGAAARILAPISRGRTVRSDVVDGVRLVARGRPARGPVVWRDRLSDARARSSAWRPNRSTSSPTPASGRSSASPVTARRLRRLPRAPLPDRVGRRRLGPTNAAQPRRPVSPSCPARATVRGWSTRSARGPGDGSDRSPSMAGARSISVPLPDGLRLTPDPTRSRDRRPSCRPTGSSSRRTAVPRSGRPRSNRARPSATSRTARPSRSRR